MKFLLLLIIPLTLLFADMQIAPDGTYVNGTPQLAPDGTYVGSGTVTLAPDGNYINIPNKTSDRNGNFYKSEADRYWEELPHSNHKIHK